MGYISAKTQPVWWLKLIILYNKLSNYLHQLSHSFTTGLEIKLQLLTLDIDFLVMRRLVQALGYPIRSEASSKQGSFSQRILSRESAILRPLQRKRGISSCWRRRDSAFRRRLLWHQAGWNNCTGPLVPVGIRRTPKLASFMTFYKINKNF